MKLLDRVTRDAKLYFFGVKKATVKNETISGSQRKNLSYLLDVVRKLGIEPSSTTYIVHLSRDWRVW